MTKYITHVLVLLAAALAGSCTLADSQPPPLAGPSEMSLSLAITANPDVLSLDGSSQTLVTVDARDATANRPQTCRCGSKLSQMVRASTSDRFRRARW